MESQGSGNRSVAQHNMLLDLVGVKFSADSSTSTSLSNGAIETSVQWFIYS